MVVDSGWSKDAVDRRSPIPAYHQLSRAIRVRIESGEWPAGHQLPTEIDLSEAYSVSRSTVRQALAELENDEIVSREHGKGTFALASPRLVMTDLSLPLGLAHRSRTQGIDLETRVIALEETNDVPRLVRERLVLAEGETVVELRRLILLQGAPAALGISWLPSAKFSGLVADGLLDGSVSQTLTTRFGIELAHYENQLEVTTANHDQAQLLNVSLEDPLLLLTALSVSTEGEAVEDSRTYWRGDRVRLTFGVDIKVAAGVL